MLSVYQAGSLFPGQVNYNQEPCQKFTITIPENSVALCSKLGRWFISAYGDAFLFIVMTGSSRSDRLSLAVLRCRLQIVVDQPAGHRAGAIRTSYKDPSFRERHNFRRRIKTSHFHKNANDLPIEAELHQERD